MGLSVVGPMVEGRRQWVNLLSWFDKLAMKFLFSPHPEFVEG